MKGLPWGGSEYLWAAAANSALDQGYEVLCLVYEHTSDVKQVRELSKKGAIVTLQQVRGQATRIGRVGNRLRRILDLEYRQKWIGILDEFSPDVLCISQGNTYEIIHNTPLLQWLDQSKTPRVHICHLNSVFHLPSDTERRIARFVFGSAARVGFVSLDNLKAAERQLAMSLPNTQILRNPVNLEDYEKAAHWPEDHRLHMALVARLDVRYKGHDLLLQALSAKTWKHRNWALGFYGDGPDLVYISELIEYFGLSDKVSLCGHVDDVKTIWLKNHLLVLPSRAEGTPLALVEAMLMGRPALVTDVGGNAEWITEPENGVVAEGVSDRSLAAALERLWTNRDSLEVMGARARAFALSNIDEDPGGTLLHLLEESALQKSKNKAALLDTTTA